MKITANTRICLLLLAISGLFAGISYAQNKVVVIPIGGNSDVSGLVSRIQALEAKLACLTPESNADSFDLQGCNVSISSPATLELSVANSMLTLNNSSATIEGNTVTADGVVTNIQAGATLNLDGALINGGGTPVARIGDAVIVNPDSGVGAITQGNPTVLF